MKVVIVFNHPYDTSYCNSIREAVENGLKKSGHEVDIIHLDNDNFNPVMSLDDLKAFKNRKSIDEKSIEYNQRIKAADHLVFIFPIWWDLMPALTKGFIDKVIFPGEAYDYVGKSHEMRTLWSNLKSTTIITTMNTSPLKYKFRYGNAMKKAFMTGTLERIGCKKVKWISLNMIKKSTEKQRGIWLKEIEEKFRKLS